MIEGAIWLPNARFQADIVMALSIQEQGRDNKWCETRSIGSLNTEGRTE